MGKVKPIVLAFSVLLGAVALVSWLRPPLWAAPAPATTAPSDLPPLFHAGALVARGGRGLEALKVLAVHGHWIEVQDLDLDTMKESQTMPFWVFPETSEGTWYEVPVNADGSLRLLR